MATLLNRATLVVLFPAIHQYKIIDEEPASISRYNCVAWALDGQTHRWIEPGGNWPPGIPQNHTVDAYLHLFLSLGFVECGTPALEPGMQKIAIYSIANEFKHVARQLPDGSWTSKLGDFVAICHLSLDALYGRRYGAVTQILCKASVIPAIDN